MGSRASLGILAHPKLRAALATAGLWAAFGGQGTARADDLLKQLFDRQAAAAIEQAKSPRRAPIVPVEGGRILVLADGRVVDGTIHADLHGYRVEGSGGNLFFGFDQVKLVARDRSDAYQKMCATDPGNHLRRDLRLGRWCLENRLPREAAFHLRRALEVEPTNQEAKSLLARLEASQPPGSVVQTAGTVEAAASDAKMVESLARLSPAVVKDFVIGVQPILVSRCGRCHSTGVTSSFQLERVHLAAGGSRTITARNLESVVRQIDPQFPRRSVLLQKAIDPHGGLSHAPLSGGGADVQKARLLAWMQKISPEINRLNREDAARRSTDKIAQAGKPQPHRDGNVMPASVSVMEQIPASSNATPAGAMPVFVPPPATPTTKPATDVGPLTDPFDPSQFNRGK